MAAPRKLPPDGAVEDIRRLAAEGYSQLGIAAHFKVSRECFIRWIEEDAELNEAYELGKETERQALHALIVASAKANKPANVNAFFLLKARHGYVETDNRTKVSVDVALNNVMVVRDHGDDATWAAKCAAQQRALTLDAAQITPLQIEASAAPQVDAAALSESPAIPAPVYASTVEPALIPAPVAPLWAAQAHQATVPYYGPPLFAWESQTVPVPANDSQFGAGDAARLPALRLEAPKWRPRA